MHFQQIAEKNQKHLRILLQKLGNPQENLSFIHVAGTNGKGSVCRFLQSILTHADFKTGLFTSPHMLSPRDRIAVDGVCIPEEALQKWMDNIDGLEDHNAPLTLFEKWTAAAFCWFSEQKCDYVVLETGLGGTQDATNVILPPKIAIITKIGLDHTALLGDTLTAIAREKAGIIKRGTALLVTPRQERAVQEVIGEACREKGVPICTVSPPDSRFENGAERFCYSGFPNLYIWLPGVHQVENACLAIEAALALGIEEGAIRTGLENTRHIGRFEVLSRTPLVIFDGAHNESGMQALWSTYQRCGFPQKASVLLGVMRDKDISGMLSAILRQKSKDDLIFYPVQTAGTRALPALELDAILKKNGFDTMLCSSFFDALIQAMQRPYPIVICGSLYLYEEAKKLMKS